MHGLPAKAAASFILTDAKNTALTCGVFCLFDSQKALVIGCLRSTYDNLRVLISRLTFGGKLVIFDELKKLPA
jgi:hypothetical protein